MIYPKLCMEKFLPSVGLKLKNLARVQGHYHYQSGATIKICVRVLWHSFLRLTRMMDGYGVHLSRTIKPSKDVNFRGLGSCFCCRHCHLDPKVLQKLCFAPGHSCFVKSQYFVFAFSFVFPERSDAIFCTLASE